MPAEGRGPLGSPTGIKRGCWARSRSRRGRARPVYGCRSSTGGEGGWRTCVLCACQRAMTLCMCRLRDGRTPYGRRRPRSVSGRKRYRREAGGRRCLGWACAEAELACTRGTPRGRWEGWAECGLLEAAKAAKGPGRVRGERGLLAPRCVPGVGVGVGGAGVGRPALLCSTLLCPALATRTRSSARQRGSREQKEKASSPRPGRPMRSRWERLGDERGLVDGGQRQPHSMRS